MKRRNAVNILLAIGLILSATLPVRAQGPAGPGFQVINPPIPTDLPGKVEVLEFFSYTCIHCANVNPAVKQWLAKAPADVVFKKIPVVFDQRQEPTAKLYYALEITGDLDRLDEAIFAAVHIQKIHLMTDKAVLDWVTGKGVDPQKFTAAYSSFGVQSKVRRGMSLTQAYKVSSTPLFFVNGRFRVETTEPKDFDRMFRQIDDLIGQSRTAKPRGIRG